MVSPVGSSAMHVTYLAAKYGRGSARPTTVSLGAAPIHTSAGQIATALSAANGPKGIINTAAGTARDPIFSDKGMPPPKVNDEPIRFSSIDILV